MGLIKGVHHINLKAADEESFRKAIDFYCGILGMSVIRQWGEGERTTIMIDTGDGVLEINASGGAELGTGIVSHYALAADPDDVPVIIEKVRNAGCHIRLEPRDVEFTSDPPLPVRMAFFVGPLGEVIEVLAER